MQHGAVWWMYDRSAFRVCWRGGGYGECRHEGVAGQRGMLTLPGHWEANDLDVLSYLLVAARALCPKKLVLFRSLGISHTSGETFGQIYYISETLRLGGLLR